MGDFIFDMCEKVFGSGLITSVGDMIDSVFSALSGLLVTYDGVINVMFGVAASLMVIYFFQSLIDQASRDMFSLEKLIVAFIKMLVAFSVMVYLPDILQLILKLGGAFTAVIEEAASATDDASVAETLRDNYRNYFSSFTHIIAGIGYVLTLIIPWIICLVCELMAKFIIISNGVMFGARMIFSPVAISQLFEDGSRSSGMKYLKGLFADAISFSVILLIMLVANSFALSAFEGVGVTNMVKAEELRSILDWNGIINIIITRLVIAGGMASASKIAHDVMGA